MSTASKLVIPSTSMSPLMSRPPNEPVPLELILPEDDMWPASPSKDKVPEIAAEPVKGNIPLTPVSSDPSPVKEPVNEPVILESATGLAFIISPTEMLGVFIKAEATIASPASTAFAAIEAVPVRVPTKEPVNEPVSLVLAIVGSLFTIEPDRSIDPVESRLPLINVVFVPGLKPKCA